MKKIYLSVVALFGIVLTASAQNPGLVISEFHQNPGGTDSPLEYVELLATDNIDFTVRPYTIIVSNNGTATADGWVEGNFITYAFEITTGSVSVGDVVYVGGTGMAPTGTILRGIDTGVDGGDGGIGNASSGGVMGNGGSNGDGIAVFDLAVGSITSSTTPVDAVFYGSGLGGAVVGGGTDGYETPNNDLYDGGKLQAADFVAVDENLTVATGAFDLETETFTIARTFADGGAGTDGISEITLIPVTPPSFSFIEEDITYNEGDGTVELDLGFTNSNGEESSADITIMLSASTAGSPDDFILLDTTITMVGDEDDTVTFTLDIQEDALEEQSEYIIITLDNFENADFGENEMMLVYITDNDIELPEATNELQFELLTSFSTGTEGIASAEIVVFDTTMNYLFVANSEANQVDIIDFSIPATPVLLDSIELDSIGGINSVAVYGDVLAVAVEAPVAQDPGFVSFWNVDGTFLNRLTVGALPDMITFNHAGTQLIVACEGEPNDDYTVDPNGGISIIEIGGAIEDLTAADVTNLDFTAFDGMEAELAEDDVRIFGLDASVAQDLEPEYVTVLEDDVTAYVVCQENNAVALVDLETKEILDVIGLGTIDHSMFGYGLDASNRTSGINIANFPIYGMFQPDAIDNLEIGGVTYLMTANEGDSRDYDGYSEEERVGDLVLDETAYPNADYLQHDHLLGRLKTTTATGDTDGDGDIDQIYSYGTRSFSIWDADGELVFDSGDIIEQIIANHPEYVEIFNAHNEGGEAEQKDRSDDKGPEPEGIVATMIDGNAYLFVSLERVGGAMAFNINDPANPEFIGYHNNRDAETNGPDRGAEGMIYIDAEISPNGNGLLVLANEVSSTLSIYEITTCTEISGLELFTEGDVNAYCEGDSLEVTTESEDELIYEWLLDGEVIEGAIEDFIFADMPGTYQLVFVNEEEACSGITDSLMVMVNDLPLVEATVTEDSICYGTEVTFSSSGAETLEWEIEGVVNDEPYVPSEAGTETYVVIGTDENGCKNSDSVDVYMAGEITIDVATTDEIYGGDGEIDITVTGGFDGYLFDWDNDGTGDLDDDEDLSDLEAGTYVIIVEDENGCTSTETIILDSQVGIADEVQTILSVYPNPTVGNLFIEMNGSFDYQLISINGDVLLAGSAYDKEMISLEDYAKGIYLVQLSSETTDTKTLKVIKR